jgi:serine/threonine-protein kinase
MNAPQEPARTFGQVSIGRAWGSVGSGKYRVFASLGRGGMAEVQLGVAQGSKGFSKLVVVKRLRPLLADDPSAVGMFLDEARIAARLNHPNLIQTYEFSDENEAAFIVMEYLEGQSLHAVLSAVREAKATVKPALWAKVCAGALAGLHYAHELQDYDGAPLHIVHRDVSPQNIVVTFEGHVKLVDFGIAKAAVNVTQTESKVVKGKLAYMSPEQVDPRLGPIDRRADVFAMGIVLWECLTGQRLLTGDANKVMNDVFEMTFPAPSSLNPAVSPELDAIVARALERPREKRLQTAGEMREALEVVIRDGGDYVSEEDVARLVRGLFSEERESIQRQIRAQMAELDGTPENGERRRSERPAEGPRRSDRPSAEPAIAESAASLRVVRKSAPRPGESRTSRVVGVAAVAVVVAAAIATGAWLRSTPAPPRVTPAAVAPAQVASVRVDVRARPSDAALLLDGAPLTNPFSGAFAQDGLVHRVEATCAGFHGATRLVRFDGAPVALVIDLEAAPVPSPSVATTLTPAAKHAPPPSGGATTPKPAPTPTLDIDLQR